MRGSYDEKPEDRKRLAVWEQKQANAQPIATKKVRELTDKQVQAWVDSLKRVDGLKMSASSRHRMLVMLRAILDSFEGLPNGKNPAKSKQVRLKVKRRKMTTWNVEQAKKLLEATEDEPLGVLWRLLVASGLRRGEALGLQWSDVRDGGVYVERNVSDNSRERVRVGTPKTEESRRFVPLGAATLAAIERHREKQQLEGPQKTQSASHGHSPSNIIRAGISETKSRA